MHTYHHPSYDIQPGDSAESRDLAEVRRLHREAVTAARDARIAFETGRVPWDAPNGGRDAWDAAEARVVELAARLRELAS